MKISKSDIVTTRRYTIHSCDGCVFRVGKVKTCLGENVDTYESLSVGCKSHKLYHKDRIVAKYTLAIGDLFMYDGEVVALEKSIKKSTGIEWGKALGVRISPETLALIHFHRGNRAAFKRVGCNATITSKSGDYVFSIGEYSSTVVYIHEIQALIRKFKKHPNF